MESIRAEKAELIGKIPPHHAAHIVRLETLRQLLLHVAPDSAGSVRRIRSRSSAHGVRAGILVNERAALAWTEAVTRVADTHVPDDVYETARAEFSERVLVDLTMAVVAINGWNRLMVAFRNSVCRIAQRLSRLSAAAPTPSAARRRRRGSLSGRTRP